MNGFRRKFRGVLGVSVTWSVACAAIFTALWGALGAALFPLLATANNSMLLIVCPLGAWLAAASVAVAKRASLRAPIDQPRLQK